MIRRLRPLHIAVLAFATLIAAGVLPAATWTLANGDRLTGLLIKETGTTIEIEHPQLGRLTLPRTALQTAAAAATAQAAAAKPAVDGKSANLAADKAGTRAPWTRQIELGFIMQEGAKSTRDLNARVQLEGRLAGNSVRATAKFTRAESEGVLTRDRDEAELRVRRDFNRRTFAQALTTFSTDDIRKIDLSLEQQLGAGYRLVDAQRQKMNVGLGAVLQRFERQGYEDQTALLASAFQDYTLNWTDRLKLSQEASFQIADRAPVIARTSTSSTTTINAPKNGNYRYRFNAALQGKMTQQISLNLRFEYDYDHSIAEPNLRSDSRLTTSLGYAF